MLTAKELNRVIPYAFGDELDYLKQLAEDFDDETEVVMLGCGPAIMALAICEVTVPWFTIIDHGDTASAIAHLKAAGHEHEIGYHIAFMKGDSAEWADKLLPDPWIDFLIVDADHSYEGVKRDIEAWWPKVKEGGLVFFHDYEWEEVPTGVKRAVEESRDATWVEVARPGISIVFRKQETEILEALDDVMDYD